MTEEDQGLPSRQRPRSKLGGMIRRIFGRRDGWPPTRRISWGSLKRIEPISRSFGFDRGLPVDRFYLESFLAEYSQDIHGSVLEVGDPGYTRRFGGARVTRSDVLHAVAGNPQATLVGRLDTREGLEREVYDCLIVTQTLHCIYDIQAAVRTLHWLLKEGGVALASLPGISQVSRHDAERWGDYWRLTPAAAVSLFEPSFGRANIQVRSYGNVLAAVALLHGLAVSDLPKGALERQDPDYPLLICVRAVKEQA